MCTLCSSLGRMIIHCSVIYQDLIGPTREHGWCCAESARLPPMWPRFSSSQCLESGWPCRKQEFFNIFLPPPHTWLNVFRFWFKYFNCVYFSDIPLCLYLHAYCRLATLWNSHRIHTQNQFYFHSAFGCPQGLWSVFVWSNCCSLCCRLSGYYWAAYACLEDNSFELT